MTSCPNLWLGFLALELYSELADTPGDKKTLQESSFPDPVAQALASPAALRCIQAGAPPRAVPSVAGLSP